MRALVQRVTRGGVTVNGLAGGRIGPGFVVLLGVTGSDGERDADYLAQKTANLRVFQDEDGKMNRSVQDIDGELLVVSQFTLYADTRKGNRPSFVNAAPPEQAAALYERYVAVLRRILGEARVRTGVFGAAMQVDLVNDGPVTILLESPR